MVEVVNDVIVQMATSSPHFSSALVERAKRERA